MKKYCEPEFNKISFDIEDVTNDGFGDGEGGGIGWEILDPPSTIGNFLPTTGW